MKRSRRAEEDIDSDYPRASDQSTDLDVDIRHVSKFTELDCAIEEDKDDSVAMRCNLPPHKDVLSFRSYNDYEVHYNKTHINRCLECKRNFPTEHLLGIHIEEWHDPLVSVKREKGEHTYSCFVEGCERKCMTHQKRRMHMIDKHMFPKNFFFAVTKEGIDGRRSLLVEHRHHRRRSSTQSKDSRPRPSLTDVLESQQQKATSDSQPAERLEKKTENKSENKPETQEPTDTDMADLTGAMSAMNFVPMSVRFGRGRAGFARR